MKKTSLMLILLAIPLCITACIPQEPAIEVGSTRTTAPAAAASTADAIASGTVSETMNTGGYTYVQVDTGSEKVWAAAPECVVNVGDQVVIPQGAPMYDYHSKTLDRDFELVYFVASFQDASGAPLSGGSGMLSGHPPMSGGHGSLTGAHGGIPQDTKAAEIDLSGVEKAEGGHTVSEIYAEKSDLSGKEVTVRGKVVKFNAQIMGKNWLHIRDGSGEADAGTNDVTVTSDTAAQVGDTVLVTGQVHLDKDFGYGYQYDVIIEDAQVAVE